jgi:hypothetical protein
MALRMWETCRADRPGVGMRVRTLRRRLLSGELVDLRAGRPELDDLAAVDRWGSGRDVPADLLVEVLTAPVTDSAVRRRVELAGARITGKLDLHSAPLTRSLLLRQCALTDPVVLQDAGALAVGFPGCSLPGLNAAGMRCRGSVDLSDGFTANGEVRLLGVRIGGQLDCTGATFRNPGQIALSADVLTVDQGMFCRTPFTAEGEVRLPGARIGGQLDCTGATFRNPGKIALNADGISVDLNMFCRHRFTADGEVRLIGARIGGQLDCAGATFHNPGKIALYADVLTVDQDMFCCSGFTTEGEVRFAGARIGGQLDCRDATFLYPDGSALDLERAQVDGDVLMRRAVFDGALDLTFTRVGAWQDDARTWPDTIRLNGFSYAAIAAQPPITVGERLGWLRRDPAGYLPQPYEQLAETFRREGHDARARQVLIAKQRHRRARHPSRWRRWPAVCWSALLRVTIGYGYRPWQVLLPAAVLFLTGWLVFDRDYDQGDIVPKADNPADLKFNAARYTADLLLPVANLGERAKFTAVDAAAWHAFAYTLAGWLLAIVLVAGLTGIFKRD